VVGLALPNTISSICLGPLGNLQLGTYSSTAETFSAPNPGINPSAGAYSGAAYWDVQSARTSIPAAGATLAVTIYDALYNSGEYGQISSRTPVYVPNFVSTAEQMDYNADIANLTANGTYISANLANGCVFAPSDTNTNGPSGRSFIILDTVGENVTAVPEPATIVAASLLLLPLGATTLRILRREKNA
jgi:hypothetical protein